MHDHDHEHRHHLTAEAQDVTRTTTLHRREFRPALLSRLRALKGQIASRVGYEQDALNLGENDGRLIGWLFAAAATDPYDFRSDAQKVDEFIEWLQARIDEGLLEELTREQVRNGEHFTASYVRSAYDRGLDGAATRLRQAGYDVDEAMLQSAFNAPIHAETLQTIYTRAYDNLEDITQDMATGIRRELTTALEEGINPKEAARRINGVVDDVGIKRARTLSRTEISNAYNTASARRYQRTGVERVRVVTSGPCPICESLADQGPYSVEEAATLIPGRTHPNCVCSIAPVPSAELRARLGHLLRRYRLRARQATAE
ncbi:phage minor head protein [Halomarina litorea]|uniref:phage minor head protein n=1 Tax=Halomarina litorea TaxID=2961595 RepID=UPI0020C30250|nr:phage minor head protein [Halomarina sp. BCD28]